MEKILYARVENGMDDLMRVLNVLRRKRFCVKSVNLNEKLNSYNSNLTIRIAEKYDLGAEQAKNQMEKLVNVHEVTKIEEVQ